MLGAWALVRKELREHRWTVFALWALCFLGFVALARATRDDGSPLVAFQQLVANLGTLLALGLVSRLVVGEYQGRTQLFLETLPVTRAQVVAVKWLTGVVLLWFPLAICLQTALWLARGHTLLGAHFVALVAIRGFSYVSFFYALAFAIGFAGRYRFAVWGVLLSGAFMIDRYAQLPFNHWPPFFLVSKSMAFERVVVPYVDLLITWSATAALVLLAFMLALAGEGAATVALYGRMTHREKALFAAVMLSIAMLTSQLERRTPKPQFQLKDAVHSADKQRQVQVARAAGVAEVDLQQVAQSLAAQLRELQGYLALSTLPALFVLPDASLDSDLYLRATLPDSDGVVLSAALGAPRFDAKGFNAFALAQTLDWYSHARAGREQRRWLLDGLVQWWQARDSASQQRLLALRAAVASKIVVPDVHALTAWLSTRERLGDCLSDALAWRVFRSLSNALGDAALQTLLRSTLGARPRDDIRGPLFETSVAEALQRVGAPTLAQLARQVAVDLAADREQLRVPLDSIQLWRATFEAAAMGGTTYEVRYRLGDPGQTVPAFAIRYATLEPWASELQRATLARVDASAPGVLPNSMGRGTRLFIAAEVYAEQLACTLRLGARRWELP